jgi:folate-binding protein YgfZ
VLSSEVKALGVGDGQASSLLNPKGKIIGVFRLFRPREDEFALVFADPLPPNLLPALRKYALLDDVPVEDASARRFKLSVEGPRAAALIRAALGVEPPEPTRLRDFEWRGAPVALYAAAETVAGGWSVEAPPEAAAALWEALCAAAPAFAGGAVGHRAAELLRIEAGVPRFGLDFGQDNFPGEAGFESALTYSKCYVGQEVVARMRTYGHVNRGLRGLGIEGGDPPAPGSPVLSEHGEVGAVGSAARSPRWGTIALALIHRQAWTPGTRLRVASGGRELAAEVRELPFSRSAPAGRVGP